MKLIIAKPSPYARKARVALHEKGIAFEEVIDVPWNANTQTPDHNPLGKVPVLILDDGSTFFDSSVIVEYLDTLNAPPRLIPSEPKERVEVKQIEAMADGVCDAVVLSVLEGNRPKEKQSSDWVGRQRRKIDAGLIALERIVPDQGMFGGDAPNLADVAVGCTLGYLALRMPEVDWQTTHPRLLAFSDMMETRSSFLKSKPAPQVIDPVS